MALPSEKRERMIFSTKVLASVNGLMDELPVVIDKKATGGDAACWNAHWDYIMGRLWAEFAPFGRSEEMKHTVNAKIAMLLDAVEAARDMSEAFPVAMAALRAALPDVRR